MSYVIKLMSANRILVNCNTFSYVVYDISISLHMEVLLDVANVRVISR